jgi:ATP-binding cassette subfamily B (MDR/TAP) protein 1
LFRYTRKWDWLLVFFGCLGALINGGSLPFYSYLFGNLVNKLSREAKDNKSQLLNDVDQVLILLYCDCAI